VPDTEYRAHAVVEGVATKSTGEAPPLLTRMVNLAPAVTALSQIEKVKSPAPAPKPLKNTAVSLELLDGIAILEAVEAPSGATAAFCVATGVWFPETLHPVAIAALLVRRFVCASSTRSPAGSTDGCPEESSTPVDPDVSQNLLVARVVVVAVPYVLVSCPLPT
jgi:hypothetical protein